MTYLEVADVTKAFGGEAALAGVDVTLAEGAFACLLGPSGCGKTTLLRIIAGLDHADAGSVRLAGRDLTAVAPHARPVGFVFQESALFPHLDVAENVAFALRLQRTPRVHRDARVAELLELVGLAGFEARRPDGLSGGEQQRVALARALAREPRLLLMDEPLASLDRARRDELRREIRRLHDATGVTTLFVTHDEEEALALADDVIVMDAGRVVERGRPRDIYLRPQHAFTARFLGAGNVVSARDVAALGGPTTTGPLLVPRDAVTCTARTGAGPARHVARVEEVRFLGREQRVRVVTQGVTLEADVAMDEAIAPGDRVPVEVAWARARAISE